MNSLQIVVLFGLLLAILGGGFVVIETLSSELRAAGRNLEPETYLRPRWLSSTT